MDNTSLYNGVISDKPIALNIFISISKFTYKIQLFLISSYI